jgi:hypothetical protein
MKLRALAWMVAGGFVAIASVAACSDDNKQPLPEAQNPGTGSGMDKMPTDKPAASGQPDPMKPSTQPATPTPEMPSMPTAMPPSNEKDAGPDASPCKEATLHTAGAGPFCPFLKPKASNCGAGQTCCVAKTKGVASVCADSCDPTVPTSLDIQCTASSQCGTGKICCGSGSVRKDACELKGSNFHKTVCVEATECPAQTPMHMCAKDSTDCPSDTTCAAFYSTTDFGVCLKNSP